MICAIELPVHKIKLDAVERAGTFVELGDDFDTAAGYMRAENRSLPSPIDLLAIRIHSYVAGLYERWYDLGLTTLQVKSAYGSPDIDIVDFLVQRIHVETDSVKKKRALENKNL